MFNFLRDVGNYESRKVGRDEFPWGFISTARVSDGERPFETAVCHAEYNDGKHVIVGAYDSMTEAKAGHQKWIDTMSAPDLPSELIDCANSEIRQAAGGKTSYKRRT